MKLLGKIRDKLPAFFLNTSNNKKYSELKFNPCAELTLGVEIELQLIDKDNLNLISKAEEILKATNSEKIKKELYLNMIEINTGICKDVHEVREDLEESIVKLKGVTDNFGVSCATTGCHPFARYSESILSPSERYNELIDRNQWLARRLTIFGLHVHIGMKSGNDAIRFNNFFVNFIPHLVALTASSPFWQGDDTGLASCRPTAYEALPTAGLPYMVDDWDDFKRLYKVLLKSNSIKVMKDLWWDIRPSPAYGTLEIRICDGIATMEETIAIVSFIHSLALWFNDNADWLEKIPLPLRWISRENKWRAIRHGLDAELIIDTKGQLKNARQDILDWLEKLGPYARKNDYGKHFDFLKLICERGNSSQRQRSVFTKTASLQEVVKHNIKEFEKGYPIWDI